MDHPVRQPAVTRWATIATASALLLAAAAFGAAKAASGPVPNFTLDLFDGTRTSLEAHRGKPVLVNFFHSK
jgi:cytochrome oxidase Cu insertion factor (SCO1/SenC/PrrC family)